MQKAEKIDPIKNLSTAETIELLKNFKTVDAARELIQLYNSCEWRDYKLQILEAIAEIPHQRSIQFLFKIALEPKDLPLSEKAILSLAQIKHPLAVRFLNHQYKVGPSYLKPALIQALASIPDRTLAEDFITDLKKSYSAQQHLLAKNLILALGDFKYVPAVDFLFQISVDKKNRDLALSAIVSLGKILRTVEKLEKLEPEFRKDSFETQLFTAALNQVQFRSQWKIEDYLQKFYSSQKYHPALFFEICSFSNADIQAGLELFASPQNTEKTLILISKLPAEISLPVYESLLKSNTTAEVSSLIWKSLSEQNSSEFKKFILENKDLRSQEWLTCLSVVLSNADEIFKDIIHSEIYSNFNDTEKMSVINSLSDFLLSMTGDSKKMNACGKWIESHLATENNDSVVGRWIRLLSDIGYEGHLATKVIPPHLVHKSVSASCLYYMKNNPHHSFTELLLKNFEQVTGKLNLNFQYVKALAAQNKDKSEDKQITTILNQLKQFKDEKIKLEILKYLIKHPLAELKSFVLENISSENQDLILFSILAVKKYGDESATELIAPYLNSDNMTLRGRALDSLLAQPGARAKRLAMDYFKANPNDVEITDKMIRCFKAPEKGTDYFVNVVSEVIKKSPEHPFIDGLIEFQSQLQQQLQSESHSGFSSTAADIQLIEKNQEKKLIFYKFYDETAKSALRSAEVPFHHPEMYDRYIDKSAIILGYSKAIDIILEKQLGRKILFPVLEKRIFEFQNAVHSLGLNEDYPNAERVLKNLGLEKDFSAQSLPVHKMGLVSHGILNTKIINEHFKILDGLRAWGIILLLFSRKTPVLAKPLLPVFSDEKTAVLVAKKLMWLQDLRNPIAHRQTIIDFKSLEETRAEVFQILTLLNSLFESK